MSSFKFNCESSHHRLTGQIRSLPAPPPNNNSLFFINIRALSCLTKFTCGKDTRGKHRWQNRTLAAPLKTTYHKNHVHVQTHHFNLDNYVKRNWFYELRIHVRSVWKNLSADMVNQLNSQANISGGFLHDAKWRSFKPKENWLMFICLNTQE